MSKKIRLVFAVSTELRDKIVAYCEKHKTSGMTISLFCRLAIIEYLANHDIDNN